MSEKPTYEELERRVGELEAARAEWEKTEARLRKRMDAQKEAGQALQESDARLTFSIESSEMGLWEMDLINHAAWRSLRHDRIFGYETSLPEWTFDMFIEHVVHEDREEVKWKFNKAMNELTAWDFECRIKRTDGIVRWIWARGKPQLNEGNEPIKMFGVVQDITDRKHAEEALKNALAEKEVLLREIHHRVKNNLQVIISLLRMHSRKNHDPHLKTVFDDCRGRVEAMSLIHETLYQSDDLVRIDFRVYLRKLCRNLRQVHGAAGKGIEENVDRSNIALNMDQGVTLGMIIAELISNAFKHAFPPGEVGNVSVGMTMPDAETVELTVTDDGKGLPPDFDMSSSRSLGMRLVWGAVTRELGGSIEATSDGGATFIIRFKCGEGR